MQMTKTINTIIINSGTLKQKGILQKTAQVIGFSEILSVFRSCIYKRHQTVLREQAQFQTTRLQLKLHEGRYIGAESIKRLL